MRRSLLLPLLLLSLGACTRPVEEDTLEYVAEYGENARVLMLPDATELEPEPEAKPEPEACEAQVKRLKQRVAKLNRTLRGYRPLPELDVVGDTPFHVFFEHDQDPIEQEIRALPGSQRPVRATYSGGRFVLRVPGVSVLHAQAQPWWRDSEVCMNTPNVRAVHGDRDSGVALVEIDYVSGGCLCGDGVYWKRISLGDDVFDAIDARPTV